MHKLKQNAEPLFTCIAEILVGILLLINPAGFTSAIIIVCGVVAAVIGLASLVNYFRADAETASREHRLSKGILLLLFGLFCAFKSEWFLLTFPLLTVLYGIATLLLGVGKVQWAVDMLRAKQKYWFLSCISAVLTIICSIVILSNPFVSTAVLWVFIGLTLIAEAIVDIVAYIFGKKKG